VPFRFHCVLQFVCVRVRAWVGALVVVLVLGNSGATCRSCLDTSKCTGVGVVVVMVVVVAVVCHVAT
jgi:hypothetical protein